MKSLKNVLSMLQVCFEYASTKILSGFKFKIVKLQVVFNKVSRWFQVTSSGFQVDFTLASSRLKVGLM